MAVQNQLQYSNDLLLQQQQQQQQQQHQQQAAAAAKSTGTITGMLADFSRALGKLLYSGIFSTVCVKCDVFSHCYAIWRRVLLSLLFRIGQQCQAGSAGFWGY